MLEHKELQEFLKQSKATPLYITKSGSQLYGTNTPESDTDYKGIFIASKESVLLKKDPEHFSFTSGEKDTKNTEQDVDITLDSIHKWNKLLDKGETGAVDLLFSVFHTSSTIYIHPGFEKLIVENYEKLISKNMHAFVGYCIGQSKRYNIKGARYQELLIWQTYIDAIVDKTSKLSVHMPGFKQLLDAPVKFKYIELERKDGSRDGSRQLLYITLLGKSFSEEVTVAYLKAHIDESILQFGNRAKAATANGVDWKGVSHALRVILEVEELLTTGFIHFPLRDREYVKDVKAGKVDLQAVMSTIDHKIDLVKELQEQSALPTKIDQSVLNNFILTSLEN